MPYLGVTPSTAASADLDGKELILDADADTTITADTDDQIDIRIAGADDFQFTANTFTAQSGSTIAAQALTATTGVFSSDVTGLTVNATGDTSAGDNAAIGYTAGEGLILTGQGSTDDITIKNDADTTILNVATGATDVEVSAGNLLFGTGSKGVYLGVTSATAANLLDDYEEGTYTATLTTATSGGYNLSSVSDTLSYTKIGRFVYIHGAISATSDNSPNGRLNISLPFTILDGAENSDNAYTRGAVTVNHADGPASMDDNLWYIQNGTAVMGGYWFVHATGAVDSWADDDVDTSFQISVNVMYHAA